MMWDAVAAVRGGATTTHEVEEHECNVTSRVQLTLRMRISSSTREGHSTPRAAYPAQLKDDGGGARMAVAPAEAASRAKRRGSEDNGSSSSDEGEYLGVR